MLAQSPEPEAHDKVLDNSRSSWNLEMLVFGERGKPEYPEKNLSEQRREPTNSKPGPGIEPGTHWWEASALTTASCLLPNFQAGKELREAQDPPGPRGPPAVGCGCLIKTDIYSNMNHPLGFCHVIIM